MQYRKLKSFAHTSRHTSLERHNAGTDVGTEKTKMSSELLIDLMKWTERTLMKLLRLADFAMCSLQHSFVNSPMLVNSSYE